MQKLSSFPLLSAITLLGAVSFAQAQQTEKSVAFATAEKKYLTAGTSGIVDLSGVKIASKQTFTLIDMNGGELADGDSVQIRYTPNPKPGEAPKPNFWGEKEGELKRGSRADTFKVKKSDKTISFQASSGKFVAPPASEGGALTLGESADAALKVEVMDAPAQAPKAAGSPGAAASPAAAKPSEDL